MIRKMVPLVLLLVLSAPAAVLANHCAFAVNGLSPNDVISVSNTDVNSADRLVIKVFSNTGIQQGSTVRQNVPLGGHRDLRLGDLYERAGIRPDEFVILTTWVEIREASDDEFRTQVTQGGNIYEAVLHCDAD